MPGRLVHVYVFVCCPIKWCYNYLAFNTPDFDNMANVIHFQVLRKLTKTPDKRGSRFKGYSMKHLEVSGSCTSSPSRARTRDRPQVVHLDLQIERKKPN